MISRSGVMAAGRCGQMEAEDFNQYYRGIGFILDYLYLS
jgi:hypothetical protein